MGFSLTVIADTGTLTVTTHLAVAAPLSLIAVMVAVPAETAVILPFGSTLAIAELSDVHVTPFILALPGLYVTGKVLLVPTLSVIALLLSVIDFTGFAAVLTVAVHTEMIVPLSFVTVIFAEPALTPETMPLEFTVATVLSDELHRSAVLVVSYGVR